MPNWCSNDLIIEMPRAIAQPFIKKHIVDGDFDFNTVIPMPPHQPDLDKPNPFWSDGPINHEIQNQFPDNNWYDWSNKHWGTKWNANDTIYYSEEEELAIHFSTAWAPVPDVIQTLSSMYPTIRFHYSYNEPGMAFAGEMTFLDGDVLDDFYYEGADYIIYNYDLDSEYYLEHPEYFVEYLEDFRAARNYEMVQVIEEYLKNNNEIEH